jgi:soluble lytic murein transglycosylase-like protein
MAALTLLLAVAVTRAALPAKAEVSRWASHIEEASARFDVPAAWIARVMHAESRGRTEWAGRPITSPAGAMGLMQLMPGTWREMRARLQLGDDPHQPRDNILAGALYLRLLYDRFGYPGLFAAYNAGPARYARHLVTGEPLPRETRDYVAHVGGPREAAPPKAPISPPSVRTLFFALQSKPASAGKSGRADLFAY